MARPIYWPTQDSYVLSVGGFPQAGIPVKIFTRQTGGVQVTDLVYVNADGTLGAAVVSGTLYSDASGLLPAFAGPDAGPTTLWGNHGLSGERIALTSDPAGAGGAVTSVDGLTGVVSLTARYGPIAGSDGWLKRQAQDPGDHLTGTITRNSNGAVTTASFLWDDGTTGVYTSTVFNATTLGKVDAWTVTYPGSPSKTVTQPTMTRDASGAITSRPALTVA